MKFRWIMVMNTNHTDITCIVKIRRYIRSYWVIYIMGVKTNINMLSHVKYLVSFLRCQLKWKKRPNSIWKKEKPRGDDWRKRKTTVFGQTKTRYYDAYDILDRMRKAVFSNPHEYCPDGSVHHSVYLVIL